MRGIEPEPHGDGDHRQFYQRYFNGLQQRHQGWLRWWSAQQRLAILTELMQWPDDTPAEQEPVSPR